jgi:hypothetical protein
MKYLAVLCCVLLPAAAESLRYSVNWPSGLSLGEATLRSDHASEGAANPWDFELELDASVPGFAVRDRYRATASADLCSAQLDKTISHGTRKNEERITFDQPRNTATRQTLHGGGKSEISISPCARDPLALLQFARRELAQGRMVPQQAVIFGSVYQIRLESKGVQQIRVGSERLDADRIQTTLKGPATDLTFEMFFARDAARTPVFVKLPLAMGAFTVELIR